jgi:hypothetical protein
MQKHCRILICAQNMLETVLIDRIPVKKNYVNRTISKTLKKGVIRQCALLNIRLEKKINL